MFLDLMVTVLASAVIGWNLESWLVPASWLAVLCAAGALTLRDITLLAPLRSVSTDKL